MYASRIGSLTAALSITLFLACATDQPMQQLQEMPPPPTTEVPAAEEAPTAYEQTGSRRSTTSSSNPAAGDEAILTAMAGRWVSDADPKEEVVFSADSYTTFYDGREVIREELTTYEVCPDVCTSGGTAYGGPCFVISGEFDATCYALVRADRSVLEISLLGGNGATLRYRRK